MPIPVKINYDFEVYPERLAKRLREYMQDLRAEDGKLIGTYRRDWDVKILFPERKTALRMDKKRNVGSRRGNLEAIRELEAIIKSCKRNH